MNFKYLGYSYDDVNYSVPLGDNVPLIDQHILGVRNYVMAGHELHVFLDSSNKPESDPGYFYAVKAKLHPEEEQTDDDIGTLLIKQMNEKNEEVKSSQTVMSEMDHSHVLDLMKGEIFGLHHDTFGPGPYDEPSKKPKLR